MKAKFKRIIKVGLAIALVVAVLGMVYTSLWAIDRSGTWLQKKLDEGGLAAVYFYKPDQELAKAATAFDKALKNQRFQQAGVKFLRVNVDKPGYEGVVEKYNIQQKFPTIVLFKDGQPDSVGGEVATLTGFTTADEIKSFVEDNFASEITAAIREIQETEEPATRRVVYNVVRERPRPTVSFGIGTGYPSSYWGGYPYGYGGYYGRPYWGGYGGRWGGGWGRGWGRGGWGGYGGGGIGFGIGF